MLSNKPKIGVHSTKNLVTISEWSKVANAVQVFPWSPLMLLPKDSSFVPFDNFLSIDWHVHACYLVNPMNPRFFPVSRKVIRDSISRFSIPPKSLIMHAGSTKDLKDGIERWTKIFEWYLGTGLSEKTALLIENTCEGGSYLKIQDILSIVKPFAEKGANVGIVWDTAHGYAAGLAEDNLVAINELMPFVKLVHFNNPSKQVLPGSHLDRHCLKEGTLVWTNKGVVEIQNLRSGVHKVWNGNNWAFFEGPFDFGEQDVLKVLCYNRKFFEGTEEHEVIVNGIEEKCSIGNLRKNIFPSNLKGQRTPGSYIASNKKPLVFLSEENFKFWELAGHYVGDGYFKREIGGVVHCFGKKDGVYVRMLDNMRSMRSYFSENDRSGKGSIQVYVPVDSVYVLKLLQSGFKKLPAWEKDLGEAIWTESLENKFAFLRGLFSADGYLCLKRHYIMYHTTSKKLAQQLQWLLASIGFNSTLTMQCNFTKNRLKKRESFKVYVWDPSKFLKEVGFIGYSAVELEEFGERYSRKARFVPAESSSMFNWNGFKSKELVSKSKVYDITVPDGSKFMLANGLMVHNSQPLFDGRLTEDQLFMIWDSFKDKDKIIEYPYGFLDDVFPTDEVLAQRKDFTGYFKFCKEKLVR